MLPTFGCLLLLCLQNTVQFKMPDLLTIKLLLIYFSGNPVSYRFTLFNLDRQVICFDIFGLVFKVISLVFVFLCQSVFPPILLYLFVLTCYLHIYVHIFWRFFVCTIMLVFIVLI